MTKNFKTIFLFTISLFAVLITLNTATELDLQKTGWYSGAIMYFFSFSFFQINFLENKVSKGRSFVRLYLFLTAIKMFLSVFFIIVYGLIEGQNIEMEFFIWFFVLYLLYTFLLSWIFYKRR